MTNDNTTTITGDPTSDDEWLVVVYDDEHSGAVPASESAVLDAPSTASSQRVIYTDAERDDRYGVLDSMWTAADNSSAHDDAPHDYGWFIGAVDSVERLSADDVDFPVE